MPELNVPNRTLFHGDNLPFLRGLNSESVHLIATDPPFNKGRDFHATPDSLARGAKFQDRWKWDDDVQGEWVDQITDDWPKVMNVINGARESYGDDMGAFLCFMAVRLIEMHRVLRSDGSIYLHCDPTASHYLKALMDALFGPDGFKTEISWKRTSAHSDARQGRRQHGRIRDLILFYTKGGTWTWNQLYTEYDASYVNSMYRHVEPETGRRYRLDNLTGPGGAAKGNPQYEVMGVTRYWRYSQQQMQGLIDAGRVIQTKPGRVPSYKRYLDEMPGVPLQDSWDDINPIGSGARERVGYPTQKPLALYERIINASSNEGDIVLDPFAGCATTPVAAERLGRKWVGADIWDGALEVVKQRMEDNRQLLTDPNPQIHYITESPERTDEAEEAVPFLQVKERYKEPEGTRMSRQEMFEYLIAQNGQRCQGCDRTFDDQLYLELDHNTPRSQGGWNHIMNRVLLCGPCNRIKSNVYTLEGLRRENRKRGRMAEK